MQDNALIYRAYIMKDWLKKQGIEVMKWPPIHLISIPLKIIRRKLHKWCPKLEDMVGGRVL